MGDLKVDVGRMREASRYAADKAAVIRTQLSRLDMTIGQELLVDGWQGRAASAYDESWVEWKHGAETVAAALEDSSTQLAAAADNYESGDEANRDNLNRVLDLGPL